MSIVPYSLGYPSYIPYQPPASPVSYFDPYSALCSCYPHQTYPVAYSGLAPGFSPAFHGSQKSQIPWQIPTPSSTVMTTSTTPSAMALTPAATTTDVSNQSLSPTSPPPTDEMRIIFDKLLAEHVAKTNQEQIEAAKQQTEDLTGISIAAEVPPAELPGKGASALANPAQDTSSSMQKPESPSGHSHAASEDIALAPIAVRTKLDTMATDPTTYASSASSTNLAEMIAAIQKLQAFSAASSEGQARRGIVPPSSSAQSSTISTAVHQGIPQPSAVNASTWSSEPPEYQEEVSYRPHRPVSNSNQSTYMSESGPHHHSTGKRSAEQADYKYADPDYKDEERYQRRSQPYTPTRSAYNCRRQHTRHKLPDWEDRTTSLVSDAVTGLGKAAWWGVGKVLGTAGAVSSGILSGASRVLSAVEEVQRKRLEKMITQQDSRTVELASIRELPWGASSTAWEPSLSEFSEHSEDGYGMATDYGFGSRSSWRLPRTGKDGKIGSSETGLSTEERTSRRFRDLFRRRKRRNKGSQASD